MTAREGFVAGKERRMPHLPGLRWTSVIFLIVGSAFFLGPVRYLARDGDGEHASYLLFFALGMVLLAVGVVLYRRWWVSAGARAVEHEDPPPVS